jgi:hypothetical protein
MDKLDLKENEVLPKKFSVRVNSSEHKRILTMIKATGMSGPELFRRALLKRMDLERPLFSPELAREFANELKRQGSNINQIARKINTGLSEGWSQPLAAVNASYLRLIQMLMANYANR